MPLLSLLRVIGVGVWGDFAVDFFCCLCACVRECVQTMCLLSRSTGAFVLLLLVSECAFLLVVCVCLFCVPCVAPLPLAHSCVTCSFPISASLSSLGLSHALFVRSVSLCLCLPVCLSLLRMRAPLPAFFLLCARRFLPSALRAHSLTHCPHSHPSLARSFVDAVLPTVVTHLRLLPRHARARQATARASSAPRLGCAAVAAYPCAQCACC